MGTIEGTYIKFALMEQKPKTEVWRVLTREGGALGEIKWFPRWRKYAFFPFGDTVYEQICLGEIIKFLNDLMAKRRK